MGQSVTEPAGEVRTPEPSRQVSLRALAADAEQSELTTRALDREFRDHSLNVAAFQSYV